MQRRAYVLALSSALLDLQSEFCLEPALLFVKTRQGNYAKALVRAEQAGGNPYHIAVWDARTYAKDQATFDSWPFMAVSPPLQHQTRERRRRSLSKADILAQPPPVPLYYVSLGRPYGRVRSMRTYQMQYSAFVPARPQEA